MTGDPPKTQAEALEMLMTFVKQSSSYRNPITVADGFVVQLVVWLEDNDLTDK